MRRGVGRELREPDDVAQQDGDGVEGLRRGDLAPLQLVDDGPAGCNSIDICWNLRLELRCKLRQGFRTCLGRRWMGQWLRRGLRPSKMSVELYPSSLQMLSCEETWRHTLSPVDEQHVPVWHMRRPISMVGDVHHHQ